MQNKPEAKKKGITKRRNQWIWKKYYEQLYARNFDNLDEMNQFLEKHKLSKCTQEEMTNLNILIFIKGIEFKIKNLPTKH